MKRETGLESASSPRWSVQGGEEGEEEERDVALEEEAEEGVTDLRGTLSPIVTSLICKELVSAPMMTVSV